MRLYALHLLGGAYDICCAECLEGARRERSMCDGLVSTASIDAPGERCQWCGREQGEEPAPVDPSAFAMAGRPTRVSMQVGDL